MGNLSLRSRLFFLSFVISQLMFITTTSQPDFFYYICSNEANYTNNSPFKKNLDNVLASISSSSNNTDSRRVDYGFYNATSGEDPDTANGKVLCRKGVPLEQCRSCVNDSVRRITQNCPTQKEGAGWYHDCQILYSNNSVHDETDLSVNQIYYNLVTAPDKNSFNEDLRGLLDRLREEAASGTSIRKSAGGDVKLKNPNMYTIYGLVDCFPDMSYFYCDVCLSRLQSYLPTCCTGSIGARLVAASCQINYEIHPLYESLLSPPRPLLPPPPPLSAPNLPPPSSLSTQGNNGNTVRTVIIVVVSVASAIILIAGICLILRLRNRKQKRRLRKFESVAVEDASDEISSIETIQFDFDVIKVATNDFSSENKLGQGGFGPVYMGKLPNGQHIAVKRLAHNSQQGNAECKNEVLLLVKLQHRNLVRLLGFCLQGSERLLIYEFVPNGSLDHFLFDLEKRTQLSWERRYKIINGIARGLLYLHEDSRLRIIHRDLKASNILLDEEMNPKIADFGLARLFQIDETQGNTNRIVGTYGYMAPEYVVHGQFSVKSDVFSFGVLVLEIVSGKKNKCFCNEENIEDLPSFTWNNWRAGTTTNAIDSTLNVGSRIEMIRCIHIGLLCVQENVANRPTMTSVVTMLSSSSLTLPIPSKPAFFMHSITNGSKTMLALDETNHSKTTSFQHSTNDASITELHPR